MKTFEQIVAPTDVETADGGRAKIVQFSDDREEGLFVRVQSWSAQKQHAEFNALIGKRVRITVEVME